MSAVLEAIEQKKFGGTLSEDRLREVVDGYTSGAVPDYQMSSLLMAIFIRGMEYGETLVLTRAMAESGASYSFPKCVDKHSTGGVGDKISLISLPIVAACGAPVAKLSGRGLGLTGGTIDKLESIPGFSANLSEEQFYRQVEEVGLAIIEAGGLAPADKAIYALRDTTGTVDSLPLIGSSIVSKKAATGAGHLLYDVKAGSGAFMKTPEDARELAGLLVQLSESMNIKASAVITDMDNPLGSAVGNALEVREAVRLLSGEEAPADLAHEARYVATRLLKLKGVESPGDAVEKAISSGSAYEKLREFVRAQGGNAGALEDLPVSGEVREVAAPRGGYVRRFAALGIGRASLALGAGREKKDAELDPGAGVEVLVKVGDELGEGQPVARLYGRSQRGEGRGAGKRSVGDLGRAGGCRPWYPGQPVKVGQQKAERLTDYDDRREHHESCSREGGAGGFRGERFAARRPAAGSVHRRELLRGREAGDRGARDARLHRHVQGRAGLGPGHRDGVPERLHRHRRAYTARGEEPPAGRDLRQLRGRDGARRPGGGDRRDPAGRDGRRAHAGRPLRPGGPLRPRSRRPPTRRRRPAGAPLRVPSSARTFSTTRTRTRAGSGTASGCWR